MPTSERSAQAISNAIAQLYKAQFGRGPTKVKTYFLGLDGIVCILEDTQTPGERRLVESGAAVDRLRDIRTFLQHAAEAELKGAIEETTGRRVRAFMSGFDPTADACSEVFLLEEQDADAMPAAAPPTPAEGAAAD
ncbi:DUF2294 domain-containing protein [Patulibacter sp. S7RM1-6]